MLLKHGAKASRRDRRRRKTAREQCIVRSNSSGKDRPVPYVETIVTLLEKAEEAEEAAEEVAERPARKEVAAAHRRGGRREAAEVAAAHVARGKRSITQHSRTRVDIY